MKKSFFFILFSLAAVLFHSCTRSLTWQSERRVDYTRYQMDTTSTMDSGIYKTILPYKNQITSAMQEVVAQNTYELRKQSPENTLGYLVTDAMMWYAEKHDLKADFAIVNSGGLRIPSLSAGAITQGKIFELMPFDNILVMLEVDSATCQKVLNTAAYKGGWAVTGVAYAIAKDSTAVDISIFQRPQKKYRIFISDYLANGGDKMSYLKTVPQENTGIMIRDLLIDYCKSQKVISIQEDKRVKYVE